MKKVILLAIALLGMQAFAQTSPEEFQAKYERQVKAVGVAGPGVITVLDKWEAAYPDDGTMLEKKFVYYLEKGHSVEVVAKPAARYLGQKPLMTLKDADGNDVNYFEEHTYLDEYFSQAANAIDRAIEKYPRELAYRIDLITALMAYEKDCPDMAALELKKLVEYDASAKPEWTYDGAELNHEEFVNVVQDYCFSFFTIGSEQSYEFFKIISETALGAYPKTAVFMTNLGSYWFVARGNSKQALKWYNKALKLDAKNYLAAKNCIIIARKEKNVKMEKKYLPIVIASTPDEAEKMSCEARLNALK